MFKDAKDEDFEITSNGLEINNVNHLTCLDQQLEMEIGLDPR